MPFMTFEQDQTPDSSKCKPVKNTGAIIMDMQASLLDAISNGVELIESNFLQIQLLQILGVPICFSEQVPSKLGKTGFDAYLLTVELYSGFNCITYVPSGKITISNALNAVFVFFIIVSSNSKVFVLDSVPDALIMSSILKGLPAEYRAASILAVASVKFSTLAILTIPYSEFH